VSGAMGAMGTGAAERAGGVLGGAG
jgi:hypothetical protein